MGVHGEGVHAANIGVRYVDTNLLFGLMDRHEKLVAAKSPLATLFEKKIERPTPDKARPPPATRYKIAELLRLHFSAYNLEAL